MFGHHHHARWARAAYACGPRGDDREGRGYGRWGRRGGGDGDGRGPRGQRPFDQGDLRYLVLDLVAEKPRHGYELIKAIEDATDGAYAPSPGVIYPTLTLLEETGMVSSEAQGARKLYSVTDEGRAYLETEAASVTAAKARMEEARRRHGPPPAAEIRRAMGNLTAALQVRLARGALTEAQLRAVVDALDDAARGVERS